MENINDYKKLVAAQKQYREESISSLKNEIARKLSPEYEDFMETIDIPMNEMLGEIYREKLKSVYKILEQNGIDVSSLQ